MDNVMGNGTVLPSGLLSRQGAQEAMVAFNRSYRNTGIKAGIVVASYAYNDPNNQNGLSTEYDVEVMEQFENKGSTSILYRNCVSTQGFGSIADFLEYTLRQKLQQTNKGFPTFSNQDGAVVLIQCLDNVGEKAIVTGALIHPDRPTTITSTEPQLQGEYNGVQIKINNDGSCSLTFKGATDNQGKPTDISQGNTQFQIKSDGSFEFSHSTISISADRSGTLSINAKVDANIVVGGNSVVTASGNASITANGTTTVEAPKVNLGVNASESVIKGDIFKKLFDSHIHSTVVGPSGPPIVPLAPNALSKKVKVE